MADGAVIATASPGFLEARWEFEVGCDFIAGQAFVRHTQRLVIDVAIHIALAFHQVDNIFLTPGWPVVLSDNDFSIAAPAIYGCINIFRPCQRIADFRPAKRIRVVQRMGDIFRCFYHLLLFDIPQHF
ncbi:hypothetical protein D3C75_638970 [compost metagenome]